MRRGRASERVCARACVCVSKKKNLPNLTEFQPSAPSIKHAISKSLDELDLLMLLQRLAFLITTQGMRGGRGGGG